jgi:hypothetical protein
VEQRRRSCGARRGDVMRGKGGGSDWLFDSPRGKRNGGGGVGQMEEMNPRRAQLRNVVESPRDGRDGKGGGGAHAQEAAAADGVAAERDDAEAALRGGVRKWKRGETE